MQTLKPFIESTQVVKTKYDKRKMEGIRWNLRR